MNKSITSSCTPFSFGQSADTFGLRLTLMLLTTRHQSPIRSTILSDQHYTHIQSKQAKEKMSFEPKTKVELDPPKDDIISLDYLSKCDGELNSNPYSSTTACLNVPRTGSNPDYPTYVAIKGTVFDVTGNKAYGPEGSYKGMSKHDVPHSPWSWN